MPPESDPLAPLWRASQAFRLITLAYAVTYHWVSIDGYSNPRLSWFFIALTAIWTGISALLLTNPRVSKGWVVLADHAVVIGLMASTRLVAEPEWYHVHQPLPTTLWATNAVIAAAILRGPVIGVVSGLLIAMVSLAVHGNFAVDIGEDATIPMLVSAGLGLGVAATTSRRAQAQVQQAARLAAATEERERLARQVHDGVLQVLAYVKRRGHEIGGPATELAEKAGEQEVALRVLISEQSSPESDAADSGEVDLRSLLRVHAKPSVAVSTPGDPVPVRAPVGTEVTAAVANALSNVERHAGPGAKAYVLLEDVGAELIVTVRDDGVGIAPGRLAQAESEGRMGVSKSIRGRIEALGGRAEVFTEPGGGTEWELRIPKEQSE